MNTENIFTLTIGLSGIVFLVVAGYMYKFPPKRINPIYGYRTAKSKKNQKSWDFAQKYSSGMLYGKEEWLEKLPPYQGGGEMIDQVTFEKTTYAGLPHKFEAGTPNICGGIAFGAALDYMNAIGFDTIATYEHELLEYGTEKLKAIDGLRIYGESKEKTAVISFNIEGIHPYDIGTILDKLGVAVRTGHHCAQPIMDFYKIPGTVRASFAFYNTKEEIDVLVAAVERAKNMLS